MLLQSKVPNTPRYSGSDRLEIVLTAFGLHDDRYAAAVIDRHRRYGEASGDSDHELGEAACILFIEYEHRIPFKLRCVLWTALTGVNISSLAEDEFHSGYDQLVRSINATVTDERQRAAAVHAVCQDALIRLQAPE